LSAVQHKRDSSARSVPQFTVSVHRERNDALCFLAECPVRGAPRFTFAEQVAQKPCGTITVAAAADLTEVMNEIVANFQKSTGCTVRVSTGSSGNFLSQIENGAPFDVFFSADIEYPRKLEAEGLAAPGSTYLYAVGKIVLWVRNDSRVDISKGFAALRDPSIQKIAIANPQHAPYGRAAQQALQNAGVYDAVKNRLVLGENISQAAQFVESGNAEAGIVALSLALSPGLKKKGRFWRIPENLYAPIEQGVVLLRASQNPQGAQKFLDYIKTPETAALLERYGFALPAKGKP
jgi:molybdate transport system substrate-binding protein